MVYIILGQLQIRIIAERIYINVHDHEGAVKVGIYVCILIALCDIQLRAVGGGACAGEVLGIIRDDGADLITGGKFVADGVADVDT